MGSLFGGKPVATDERRQLIRVPYRAVVEITAPGGPVRGALTDLSPGGFRFEAKDKLKVGDMVTVSSSGGDPVQCKVCWTRQWGKSNNHYAGLKFEDTKDNLGKSWVKEAMLKAGFADGRVKERRKFLRIRSEMAIALCNNSGDILADGILLNLSLGGALIRLAVEFKPGQSVRLQVPEVGGLKPLDMKSSVRSCRRGRDDKFLLGLQFDDANAALVKKYIAMLFQQFGKTVG